MQLPGAVSQEVFTTIDWQWDIHLEAFETKWKESKTLKTYILLFCNDAEFMEIDVLFLFGTYMGT